jgi:hypothetical protein
VRIDRDDAAEGSDGHPDGPDVPGQCEGEQAGPDEGDDRSGPADEADEADESDEAVQAERAVAYPDAVRAVYRAYAIDQGCAEVEKIEKDTVTPAMLRIEAEDPDRSLVGLENRLKEKERLCQKVAKASDELGRSVDDAFAMIKDAIRYTLCYPDDRYTPGVYADCERLEGLGFERVDRENSWTKEQYKGINSRWRVPESGQLFEVQFHTEASYAAKEETHPAYEKLRVGVPTKAEQRELEEFQKQVTARIPIPPGAAEIPDYP